MVHGMYKLISSAGNIYVSSCLSQSFQLPLIPPTHYLKSILFLPFSYPTAYLYRWLLLSSFPPPFYSHTYPLSSPPPSLPLHPSPSLLLCVFCFGAVIFRLISEVMHFLQIKEEARLPPPLLLLLLPSLSPFLSLSLPPTSSSFPPCPVSRSRPPLGPPGQRGDKGAPIISLLVLIWAAQGFQVPPITPRNIITSSPGNTAPHTHTLEHTHACTDCQIQTLTDCKGLCMHSKHSL